MRRYAFIFNPAARMGRARRQERALLAAIEAAGIEATVHRTAGPRHAVFLAREQAERADAVVAVGGDGTVHEVAEGLVAHGGRVPLGVVPIGTGNDFAKMLGMPTGFAAIGALEGAEVTAADYGVAWWQEGADERMGYFFNGLGIGFDAQVAAAAPRYKRLPGVAGYLLAVLDTLRRWRGPDATVMLDGVPFFDAPLLLVAVGNGTTAGGGFILTPAASIVDGHLDVCAIRDVPRRRIVSLLPTALRGTHVQAPEVTVDTFRTLHLVTGTPVAIHADGEMLTQATEQVWVEVVPGGLSVLTALSQVQPS